MRARHQGRAGRHRPAGALCGRLASMRIRRKRRQSPEPNGHKRRGDRCGPGRADLRGRLGAKWATRSRCLKRCTWRAACWSTAFRSSVCRRRSCRRKSISLKALGVDVETNMVIGKVLTIDELFERRAMKRYSSAPARVCRALWASRARASKGVYSANEFLTRSNLMKAYQDGSASRRFMHGRQVAVVGGGNVAMDAARTRAASGRGRGIHRVPPRHGRAAGPPRRGGARGGGRHHLQDRCTIP